jgi:LPS O-antigen subunit length determinant protein (WzzB/FepE family)
MARNFNELREKMYAKMTPEQRAKSDARVAKMIETYRLNQLRQARKLTQAALAAKMGTDQGSISRMEQQGDFYVSTLRSYIEATGGRLEMQAVYPDHSVLLDVVK